MGKMALLLVLGLSVAVGIISYTMNQSKSQLGENVTGFDRYSIARNIAHTGVNIMLRRLDKSDTTIVNPLNAGHVATISEYIMAGQCSVYARLKNPAFLDTVDLMSKSRFMDSTYTMILRLQRYPKPFPKINSTLGLASVPFNFQMVGTPHIYGENYDMDGTRGDPALDTNGVTVVSPAESSIVAAYSSKITGDPYNIKIDPPDNPISYVPEYIAGADIVFPDGSNNSGIYGSQLSPVLGFADGTVKFGGSGKFYGVLVIRGTMEIVGTFDIYGLVIAYGDSNVVNVSTTTGTPQVWGAVLATGPAGSKFTMKGTADLRYSKEALEMAKYINKLQAYRVIWWYE